MLLKILSPFSEDVPAPPHQKKKKKKKRKKENGLILSSQERVKIFKPIENIILRFDRKVGNHQNWLLKNFLVS